MAALTTKKRARILSTALFLIFLAIVSYTELWWPGIMLAIGIPLAMRHALLGRYYDAAVSLFIFVGGFIAVQYSIAWQILLPVIFTVGAIYIFFRDYVEAGTLAEDEDDMNLSMRGQGKKAKVSRSVAKKVKPAAAPKKKPKKAARSFAKKKLVLAQE